MSPDRKRTIGEYVVTEYYWNGKMVVYIDSIATDLTFEAAIKECERRNNEL